MGLKRFWWNWRTVKTRWEWERCKTGGSTRGMESLNVKTSNGWMLYRSVRLRCLNLLRCNRAGLLPVEILSHAHPESPPKTQHYCFCSFALFRRCKVETQARMWVMWSINVILYDWLLNLSEFYGSINMKDKWGEFWDLHLRAAYSWTAGETKQNPFPLIIKLSALKVIMSSPCSTPTTSHILQS